ncbi:type III pantothenate kinase [Nibrella saemangeumensis]|uniref:Type III pantothenate kinase n=1 Tax=Nibrella saemangeumensis TaxID=1084526 RepID=A0ABP8MVE4_9BACT
MNLVVDWGNSSLKLGWFEGSVLTESRYHVSPDNFRDLLRQQVRNGRQPDQVIVSSTSRPGEELRAQVAELGETITETTHWLIFDNTTSVPVSIDYDTPLTLGTDRVAAGVGATVLFPGEDCLVIDMGTCITADVVDQGGVFRGGLISPGLRMRFRGMHVFTERLPLIEPDLQAVRDLPALIGKNTHQAMQSGAINGMLFELNGIIAAHRSERPNIKVVVCGGDALFFESRLKPPIFVVPEVVLIGLNRILEHNVK